MRTFWLKCQSTTGGANHFETPETGMPENHRRPQETAGS